MSPLMTAPKNRPIRRTAALLIIGNEILSGRTQDANARFLAVRLGELGISLMEMRVVADDAYMIVRTVRELADSYDYVFTTGGIGPTHDDITSACVGKAFGKPLEINAEAKRRLLAHYTNPADLNAARLRMATIPVGATLIDNPVSAAPGFRLKNVLVMAGVPRIMQAMFECIAHTLECGAPVRARTLTVGIGEGVLASGLGEIQGRYAELDIGSYPFYQCGGHGCSIVVRGTDEASIGAAVEEVRALMQGLGADPIETDSADG